MKNFITARKEARNFREYFEAGREASVEDRIKQHEPQDEAPSSINDALAGEESVDEDEVVSGPPGGLPAAKNQSPERSPRTRKGTTRLG
jgi:hypothetical protein